MHTEFNFILAAAAFAAIIAVLYGPWQSLWTDWARQQMFEVRNALFDMAYEGKLSFDDPNYKVMRASVESSIRFAHQVTWLRVVFWTQMLKFVQGGDTPSRLRSAVEAIQDPDTHEELNRLRRDMGFALCGLIAVRSPAFMVLALIVVPFVLMRFSISQGVSSISQNFSSLSDRVQSEAEIGDSLAWT